MAVVVVVVVVVDVDVAVVAVVVVVFVGSRCRRRCHWTQSVVAHVFGLAVAQIAVVDFPAFAVIAVSDDMAASQMLPAFACDKHPALHHARCCVSR